MFVYYIQFFLQRKKFLSFLGASVPSLIFLLALILCVYATVLCWGMRSGVHNTRVCWLLVPMQDWYVNTFLPQKRERAMLLLATWHATY